MHFTPTPIADLYVVDLERRQDERGFFARAWCEVELAEHGFANQCRQAHLSFNSRRGTLRGMHFQLPPHAEAKSVRVVRGAVHDVVLDLRADSATYGQWFACELSAENRRALFIPEGCAHGYITLTDDAELFYLVSALYEPGASRGVHWDCQALRGAWPFTPTLVAEKDQQLPRDLPRICP